MVQIRAKVRERTDRRYACLPWDVIVKRRLNPVLRGWGNYFRYGNASQKFDALDSYVNMRLARLASVKHGRNGRGWTTRFDYEWVNSLGTYRLTGTVERWPAHA